MLLIHEDQKTRIYLLLVLFVSSLVFFVSSLVSVDKVILSELPYIGILFEDKYVSAHTVSSVTQKSVLGTNQDNAVVNSAFTKALEPIYDKPKRLYTETHGIDISLIEVGVEPDGKLENPKDWNVGGWFYKSSKPGEHGNIIINAHYDNNWGAPAAFWKLKNIVVDDKVYLVDSLGKIHTYKVTKSFYLDIDDPNRLSIFEDVEDKSELTLITCGGVWDFSAGTYNKRLVVKAELLDTGKNEFVETESIS